MRWSLFSSEGSVKAVQSVCSRRKLLWALSLCMGKGVRVWGGGREEGQRDTYECRLITESNRERSI